MQAANWGLNLNRNDLADGLDFDTNLKINPFAMIQIINQKWLELCKIELDLENNLANKRLNGR